MDEDISKYIPSFANAKVYKEGGDPLPLNKPITIRHLMTHTSGMFYALDGLTFDLPEKLKMLM